MTHTTTHTVMIGAPAKVVYDLIADVTRWPYIFGPTVHAEVFETDGTTERLRLHAFANGDVRTWTSRRELDSANLHVKFEQERCLVTRFPQQPQGNHGARPDTARA